MKKLHRGTGQPINCRMNNHEIRTIPCFLTPNQKYPFQSTPMQRYLKTDPNRKTWKKINFAYDAHH